MLRRQITISTRERFQIIDITAMVNSALKEERVRDGILLIYCPHTTAAISVNESDPDLWIDIINTLKRLIPVDAKYRHNSKYSGIAREMNAHAHIGNILIGRSVILPVVNGRLNLGTWQSILFIEMDGPRNRRINLYFYT